MELVSVVFTGILTILNLFILGMSIKLYTEIFKEKRMNERRRDV